MVMGCLGGLVVCIAMIAIAAAIGEGEGVSGFFGGLAILGIAAEVVAAFVRRIVPPTTATLVVLCGTYKGTLKDPGFWWVNPFSKRSAISLRTRNMVTPTIKVNDVRGTPVEIGAVVVWRVVDRVRATFDVD